MNDVDDTEVRRYLDRLFDVPRSLTGDGNRRTLDVLSEITQLRIQEVPSGTSVYDWEVPAEWNLREAYIRTEDGEVIVDAADRNLHVVNYSVPVDRTVGYDELADHVYTLPEMPETIPYRTTYYERTWGFCLQHETLQALDEDAKYEVYIDTELDPDGSLTYADARVEGRSEEEYLLSAYCCHPSMANDNLSGLLLATYLFEHIRNADPYHSYRLVIAPETIGTITYLNQYEAELKAVNGGYVITTVAGPGKIAYKESFAGDAPVDVAARRALRGRDYDHHEFVPNGSDERQYSSPGFRIPTGTIAKDKYYEYDEYHTSDDDLAFVSPDSLLETLAIYRHAFDLLEMNRRYKRVDPHCEFKLDRHGLHPTTGGQRHQPGHLQGTDHDVFEYRIDEERSAQGVNLDALCWLMFGCDGDTSLFELAERRDLALPPLFDAAQQLVKTGLLREVSS